MTHPQDVQIMKQAAVSGWEVRINLFLFFTAEAMFQDRQQCGLDPEAHVRMDREGGCRVLMVFSERFLFMFQAVQTAEQLLDVGVYAMEKTGDTILYAEHEGVRKEVTVHIGSADLSADDVIAQDMVLEAEPGTVENLMNLIGPDEALWTVTGI